MTPFKALPTALLFRLALLILPWLGGCASDDARDFGEAPIDTTPGIAYEVRIEGVNEPELVSVLEASMRLFTLNDRPPPSLARLRRRAEADLETVQKVLRAEGYYEGSATFALSPTRSTQSPSDNTGDDANEQPPQQNVVVTISPGDRFTFADVTASPGVTDEGLTIEALSQFGAPTGAPARASRIVDAENRLLDWLSERGYYYATIDERDVVANLDANTLTVTTELLPGPQLKFGPLRFEGLKSVDSDYLASYTPWKEGEVLKRSALDQLQTSLFATNLFESVSVEPPVEAQLGSNGDTQSTPITVRANERKHRTVGAGLRFSTDEGPEATAFIEHRNLFGANETGRVSILGGLQRQEFNVSFRKPQFLHQPQVLYASLLLRHEDDEAFEERTVRLDAGLERRLSKRLTVSGGLSVELSQIDDDLDGNFDVARLIGAPMSAHYDASNNLLDPTRGYRLGASVTPYSGTYNGNTLLFTVLDVDGSIYLPLDRRARHVIALRARAGSLLGAERDDVPPTKRLYSGGGGSVRGYETRFIGPLDTRGDPLGGRSVVEAGLELRTRVGENLGIVPFVEAGTVSERVLPQLNDDVQYAAGLGVRYYTVIGPIRADVALPLNRREEDDLFQFYVSIGQAF